NFISGLLNKNSQDLHASGQVIGVQDEEFGQLDSSINQKWFLLGDQFTLEQQLLEFTVPLTSSQVTLLEKDPQNTITYTINENGDPVTLPTTLDSDSVYKAVINTSSFKPGVYTIQATATIENKEWSSAIHTFYVSYPVYVTWTIDWEGYDVKDEYLADMAQIADDHQMPLTHFFNPRIYTNSDISNERADYLTHWVLDRKTSHGDMIGLHLHMFPDMVEAAGVTPIEEPVVWGSTLTDGYDILAANYGYEDMVKMLDWSKETFSNHQLGTPTIFRAGGWYADMDVLKAVNDTGFIADSSGRTKYEFGEKKIQGFWDLSIVTQPYHPNIYDQNISTGPSLSILEIPNNGADSWMFSSQQMIDRFNQNKPNLISDKNMMVTYLSHPEWFKTDKPKMEAVFDYIDQYKFDNDNGPVLYVTLEETYNIWE
ncbi:hypothetical protein KC571_03970, partial [candidate division WWE3 bacterium]|nr:hypothetical protein [candidate division WWE3 bacterium]